MATLEIDEIQSTMTLVEILEKIVDAEKLMEGNKEAIVENLIDRFIHKNEYASRKEKSDAIEFIKENQKSQNVISTNNLLRILGE